jgi:hypothetical protein
MSSTYLAFSGWDEKEHLLSRGEEPHTKRVLECLMLKNHSIIVIIFSPIDFKKSLTRRDTDERFHLSTTQDKVKTAQKES